ncbi:MAG: DNA polymerase III subunit delta [Candidatus Methylomirabilales bacterium]
MAPVYLLLGEEIALRQDFLSRLLKTLLPPGMEALNLDILSGHEVAGVDVAVRCRVVPAFSPRRVIVLKEADRLRMDAWEAILAALEVASPTACLICIADRLDQRNPALQQIERIGKILRFAMPRSEEERRRWCQRWMKERAQQQGKSLTPEAELLLLNLQGPDLLRLGQEVDKLCLFVGEEREINLEAVEALVGEGRVREVFELTRAVSRRDQGAALSCLRRLLEGGEDPLGILGMLARQVRLLLRAKELLIQSRPPAEISRLLGVPRQFVSEILEGAMASSQPRLEQGLVRLLDLDRTLKSRGRGQPLHVELAVIDLCR